MHYYYCLSLCFLELWIHLIIGSDLKTMFALGHCFSVRSIGEQASEQQTLFLLYVGLLSVIARSDLCVLLLVPHPWHHSQSHHSEFVCWFLQQATPSMGLVWNLFYKLKLKWVRERGLWRKKDGDIGQQVWDLCATLVLFQEQSRASTWTCFCKIQSWLTGNTSVHLMPGCLKFTCLGWRLPKSEAPQLDHPLVAACIKRISPSDLFLGG